MPARTGPPRLRQPALKGVLMVDTFRGKLRVRKWPKKRGPAKHPHTRYMNAWFKDAMKKLKLLDGRAYSWAIEVTKGTGLYPRDILLAASSSGLYELSFANGETVAFRKQGLYPVSFQGTILQLGADYAMTSGVGYTPDYPTPLIDTAGLYSPASPKRLTIPAGVNVINVTATLGCDNASSVLAQLNLRANGTTVLTYAYGGPAQNASLSLSTGPIPVVAGDYFEAVQRCYQNCNALAALTRFQIEILDVTTPEA